VGQTKGRFKILEDDNRDKNPEDYENRTDLHGVVHKKNFDFIKKVNQTTVARLGGEWARNVKKNKKMWRKNSTIKELNQLKIGRNKAVIGIGAGPSFHKNKHILKDVVVPDGLKSWEDREFLTIAANHQFKPLLKMGIIPDFVLLVDGAGTVSDQLIKDIPKEAKGTQLITGVHVNPKLLKEWYGQGRNIVFYTTPADVIQDACMENGLRGFADSKLELGGNVLNGSFMMACAVMQSTVFMGVGNDLSFPVKDDLDDQRSSYYADGDYSTNLASKRDEGKSEKRWAGFTMERRKIISPTEPIGCKARYNFELDIVGTSHTLWVYKTWLESVMMGQCALPVLLHYFNCSESGILGVMAKEETKEALRNPENWYFLDETCINKHTGKQMYMTAMLEDAVEVFLRSRRSQKWEHCSDARYADISGAA